MSDISSDDSSSWRPNSDVELEAEMNLMRLGRSASAKSLILMRSNESSGSDTSTINSSQESFGRGIDLSDVETNSSWVSSAGEDIGTGMNSSQDSEGNPIAPPKSYFLLNEVTTMKTEKKWYSKKEEISDAKTAMKRYTTDFGTIERNEIHEEVYDESNPGIIYCGNIPIFRDPKYFKSRLVDPEAYDRFKERELRRKRRHEKKIIESEKKLHFTGEYMQNWENHKSWINKKLEKRRRKREIKLGKTLDHEPENQILLAGNK